MIVMKRWVPGAGLALLALLATTPGRADEKAEVYPLLVAADIASRTRPPRARPEQGIRGLRGLRLELPGEQPPAPAG